MQVKKLVTFTHPLALSSQFLPFCMTNAIPDPYITEWGTFVSRGLAAWTVARDWNRSIKRIGGSVSTVQRSFMDGKVREACDAFCCALSVVGRVWMRDGGILDQQWMRRQLLTEKNIALSLYALRDISGAVHYMHSAICVLVAIMDRFGTSPWVDLLGVELRRFKSLLADRPSDRDLLPPMSMPYIA